MLLLTKESNTHSLLFCIHGYNAIPYSLPSLKTNYFLIATQRTMSVFWAIVIVPVFLASVPANFSIIKHLKEKPLGRQTILDIAYRDFFTCNLIAIVVHGICISYVNTGDLLLLRTLCFD